MRLLAATVVPMISIEFQITSINVNESDGSVIINLLRTGNYSDNFTVCINITMIVDPAIAQRMCKLYIACSYIRCTAAQIYMYLNF